jgi:hypothetical protein
MAGVIPNVRLVYLVRDPIERLLSHFHMALVTGRERRPLGEAVTDAAASWYVAQGRYWTQLEAYLRHFDAGQVLVVDQHELLLDRRAALRRVFAFAGVDVEFDAPDFDEVHFPAMDRRRRRPVAKAVLALDGALGNDRSYELRRRVPAPVHRVLSVPLERPAVEPTLRERLEEIYAPEVERLREHTGLRFETWGM